MQGGFNHPATMTGVHPQNGGQLQGVSQHPGTMTPPQPMGGAHTLEPIQPSLPPEQQRIVSLAFQTVNLSAPQKQAVNLIFENKNKSALGVNLAAYAVLNQQQQAAFRGAYHKLVMLAQNGQLPMQPTTTQQQPGAMGSTGGGFTLPSPTPTQTL